MSLIDFVSAHTGNDFVNHGFEMGDFVFGVVVLVVLGLVIWKIKKYKKGGK